MPCPICGTEMIFGSLSVHDEVSRFLFDGVFPQHLFFEPDENGMEHIVIQLKSSRPGFCCPSCDAAVITSRPSEPDVDDT